MKSNKRQEIKKKELDDAERERILLERQREKDDQIAYAEG